MTNMELINILSQYDGNLHVLVEESENVKVCYEECQGHGYLRIIKPWDIDIVLGSAGLREEAE